MCLIQEQEALHFVVGLPEHLVFYPPQCHQPERVIDQASLARRHLGGESYLACHQAKRQEWDEYRMQVSQWETDRYLEIF